MGKTAAIVATLDTKGAEAEYVRRLIEGLGCSTLVIDVGVLGEPGTEADVRREEVAAAGGGELEELRRGTAKGRAMAVMMAGATAVVARLYREGRIHGVLSLGGVQNTAIATAAMQALPLGVPKLAVSAVASGHFTFGPFVGTKDVALMHSVCDVAGINALSRRVFENAARAMVGMLGDGEAVQPSARPTIGATMLGMTTPCVAQARRLLEQRGYEVVTFHANGTGGRALEELVTAGLFCGVLDVTTVELTGELVGGLLAAPGRLTAAARAGLPQVVAPGCLEVTAYGPLEGLPEELRARPHIAHNPYNTAVRISVEEAERVAAVMAERLNGSVGPVTVVAPLRGFSEPNTQGRELYDPEGNRALVEALRSTLRPGIRFVEVDAHINDPAFAEAATAALVALLER